jgi:Bacterial Ig-like domain (group 3)/Invasin, domain 3/PKD domain/Right handed beta helix region
MGLWPLAALIFLIGSFLPSTAAAISTEDQQYISYLRSIFSIDSGRASDQRLAQILDSPKLGPSVRGDVDCAFTGLHALDSSGAQRAVVETLLSEYEAISAADQFADPLIIAGLGNSITAQFLVELHQDLGGFRSALSTFVNSEAYLLSDGDYRSWLAQYHGAESEGMTSEEARSEIEETAGSALDAVLQPRRLSADELFGQYEYASRCMSLDEDATYRTEYANYIIGIVQAIGDYEKGKGLTLVPTGGSEFTAINTGKAQLGDVVVREADGSELGQLDELEPGADRTLSIGGSTGSAAKVSFTLDGIPGLEADYSSVASNLFVGQAVASLLPGLAKSSEFSIDQGPFAATGTSPTYEWAFEGGGKAAGASVSRSFPCYGLQTATFTATSSVATASRKATLDLPPPYTVDWTASTGEFAVAPGVPITLTADPSIPTGASVSWNFGDGQSAQGRSVTHTFQSAAIDNVVMSVIEPGCSALTMSHPITVGRSDQWVTLSGSTGTRTLKSSVAGYVVVGPTTVGSGQTLTVEPGAVVKFAGTGGERGQLLVSGTLNVKGVEGAPAIFTSRFDDSAGGHCSCAGTGTPTSGDWYGLTLLNGGRANVDHAEVRYAASALDLQSSSAHLDAAASVLADDVRGLYSSGANDVSVRASTFLRNAVAAELECFGCTYSPQLLGNRFRESTSGVWVKGSTAARIRGSTFEEVQHPVILESTALRTSIEGTVDPARTGYVQVSEGSLSTGVVRPSSDLPYAFFGQITVPQAGQLALGPGTRIKFVNTGGSLSGSPGQLYVRGSLVASGTGGSPVVLTSSYDDSVYGHCGCVKAGVSPASGNWFGVVIAGGGSETLDHTTIRYAGADDTVQGSGSNVRIANSVLDYAGTGLAVEGVSDVAVSNSSASHDNTGLQLNCNGCAYTVKVTNATFAQDSTGIGLTGNASAVIRSSSFDAADHWGIYNGGNATVDAVGNWWGAASGPQPAGVGPLIVGKVSYQPFCGAPDQCTSVEVFAEPAAVDPDGSATTTLTAIVESPAGRVAGDHVYFTSSDAGQAIGPVVDHGDGTYTATLTASHAVGAATVTAYDASLNPRPSGSVEIEQKAPALDLSLDRSSVPADGQSVIEATVSVTGVAHPLSGEPIEITSSDPGQAIGPVVDHGDGTYTTKITASKTVGSATIVATDDNYADISATAVVEQVAPPLRPAKAALAATPNPSRFGAPVKLLATVTAEEGGAPAPTGTVTFVEGSTTLGVVGLKENGTAELKIASLSVGAHHIVAEYGGDSRFAPTTSSPLTQTVARSQTQVTLSSWQNPSPFGSGAAMSANVRALAPGSGTPTGTVTFSEGATVLAIVPVTERVARLPLKGLAVGEHQITATYNGDGSFLSSTSSPLTQTVNP